MLRIGDRKHPPVRIVKDLLGLEEVQEEVQNRGRVLLLHLVDLLDELFQRYLTLLVHFAVHECPFEANNVAEVDLVRPYTILYLHLARFVEVGAAHEFDHVLSLQVPEEAATDVEIAREMRIQMLVGNLLVADRQLSPGLCVVVLRCLQRGVQLLALDAVRCHVPRDHAEVLLLLHVLDLLLLADLFQELQVLQGEIGSQISLLLLTVQFLARLLLFVVAHAVLI